MSQTSFSHNISNRIAEENQLLAEERWLIDALTKIKNQRNCLQIEKLHLESMKTQLEQSSDEPLEETNETSLQTTAHVKPEPVRSSRNSIVFEEPLDNEATCNDEELNLLVRKPHFSQERNEDFNMEEYEEDEDCDNVLIDMNMLMNGAIE